MGEQMGLMLRRKKTELNGQPVLAPPSRIKRKDSVPIPGDPAEMFLYMERMAFIKDLGRRRHFKTINIQAWMRVGNALQKSYRGVQGSWSMLHKTQLHFLYFLCWEAVAAVHSPVNT